MNTNVKSKNKIKSKKISPFLINKLFEANLISANPISKAMLSGTIQNESGSTGSFGSLFLGVMLGASL